MLVYGLRGMGSSRVTRHGHMKVKNPFLAKFCVLSANAIICSKNTWYTCLARRQMGILKCCTGTSPTLGYSDIYHWRLWMMYRLRTCMSTVNLGQSKLYTDKKRRTIIIDICQILHGCKIWVCPGGNPLPVPFPYSKALHTYSPVIGWRVLGWATRTPRIFRLA